MIAAQDSPDSFPTCLEPVRLPATLRRHGRIGPARLAVEFRAGLAQRAVVRLGSWRPQLAARHRVSQQALLDPFCASFLRVVESEDMEVAQDHPEPALQSLRFVDAQAVDHDRCSLLRENRHDVIDVFEFAVVGHDLRSVQADLNRAILLHIANGRRPWLDVVDETFGEQRVVAEVDQVRHFLRRAETNKPFLDADPQFFQGRFSLFMDLFRLEHLFLPRLVQILVQLFTLVQLLHDLRLADLGHRAITLLDRNELLFQRGIRGIIFARRHTTRCSSRSTTSTSTNSTGHAACGPSTELRAQL